MVISVAWGPSYQSHDVERCLVFVRISNALPQRGTQTLPIQISVDLLRKATALFFDVPTPMHLLKERNVQKEPLALVSLLVFAGPFLACPFEGYRQFSWDWFVTIYIKFGLKATALLGPSVDTTIHLDCFLPLWYPSPIIVVVHYLTSFSVFRSHQPGSENLFSRHRRRTSCTCCSCRYLLQRTHGRTLRDLGALIFWSILSLKSFPHDDSFRWFNQLVFSAVKDWCDLLSTLGK